MLGADTFCLVHSSYPRCGGEQEEKQEEQQDSGGEVTWAT